MEKQTQTNSRLARILEYAEERGACETQLKHIKNEFRIAGYTFDTLRNPAHMLGASYNNDNNKLKTSREREEYQSFKTAEYISHQLKLKDSQYLNLIHQLGISHPLNTMFK
ncbi:MAG: hypothetical protein ACOCUU_00570 [Nanoarchaeota archaeon]